MEKELKSCTGVLLRADLTGHGHIQPISRFLPKREAWPSKGHPCRISIPIQLCPTTLLAPLGDLFCLVIFLEYSRVCMNQNYSAHMPKTKHVVRNAASSKMMGGHSSNMAGIICPLGPNRVNWYPKTWGGTCPPGPPTCDGPVRWEWNFKYNILATLD